MPCRAPEMQCLCHVIAMSLSRHNHIRSQQYEVNRYLSIGSLSDQPYSFM